MNFNEALKVLPQYLLPQHALSNLMGKLTHCENKAVRNLLIREIAKRYKVNLSEALEQNLDAFKHFNAFFTRELKPGARPLCEGRFDIASPADGVVSQAGAIVDGDIFQAKGKSYTAAALLGGTERAEAFKNGQYATIYLSPKDYHRLHMPLSGTLTEMVHIPGRLFSVNQSTTNAIPGLFSKNERVCCFFDTEAGPMALVLVGAILVSGIETVWHGEVTPPSIASMQSWTYAENAPVLNKGEEMGRFNMGSTIIVLFAKDKIQWQAGFQAERPIKVGEQIGLISP